MRNTTPILFVGLGLAGAAACAEGSASLGADGKTGAAGASAGPLVLDIDATEAGPPEPAPNAGMPVGETIGVTGRIVPGAEWNCGERCFRDALVSPSLAEGFGAGGDPALAPSFAYPLDGSMHAVNVPDLTVQWRRADAAQTVFRLEVAGAAGTYEFFMPCGDAERAAPPIADPNKCVYTLPEGSWHELAIAHAGQPVELTLSGTDGTAVGSSAPLTLSFSAADVVGGMYYWGTGLSGTYRVKFGARTASPFIFQNSAANDSSCGGCHAVSRDGTVIAFVAEDAPGNLVVSNTAEPAPPLVRSRGETDASMMALNPDGSRVLVATDTRLVLRDTATGATLGEVDASHLGDEGQGYFPEFSPDGTEIVLTLSNQPDAPSYSVRSGSIAILPYNGGAFGPARVVVPMDQDFHYYPTWSPDGQWIAFASAPVGGGNISYDQNDSRLRMVSRDGGQVYELTRATQGVGLASTLPKFTPFAQADGNLMFITFNSKINYGFTVQNDLLEHPNPQLWLAAIDLRLLDSGDPSFAPVWLTFQDTRQGNHLGYWTEAITCVPGGPGCDADSYCVVAEDSASEGECVFMVR